MGDINQVMYSIPRAEIVDSLNHTLSKDIPSSHTGYPNAILAKAEESPIGRAIHDQSTPSPESSLDHRYVEHNDTIDELADSAYLCECQGRHVEAERLYRQVLILKQRRLGSDHLEVATSLNDLATLYASRNRHKEAQPLLQQALRIQQQHLLANHPDIGETLYQLAKVHGHQEHYGKAEPLFQMALEIFRQRFGSEHLRTQAVYTDMMQMIAVAIEDGKFSELTPELPPLDLNTLSDTYSWARPSWQR